MFEGNTAQGGGQAPAPPGYHYALNGQLIPDNPAPQSQAGYNNDQDAERVRLQYMQQAMEELEALPQTVRAQYANQIGEAAKQFYLQKIQSGVVPGQAMQDVAKVVEQQLFNVADEQHIRLTSGKTRPTAAAPTGPQAPGVLTTPGTAEQWYAQNKQRYSAPSQYQGWVNEYANKGGWAPSNQTAAWGEVSGKLGQGGWGAQNSRDVASRLFGKTEGEGITKGALGYFQNAGSTDAYAKSLGGQEFTRPGAAEDYWGQAKGSLSGQGEGTQFAYNRLGDFGKEGQSEKNYSTIQGMLGGANNTSDFYNDQVLGSGFLKKNTTGTEQQYFAPQLREKSNSEKLYESGNQGLNTFYDREAEKRSRRLGDQMAAAGVFGSGATARSLAELEGELGAAQARDMAGLAGQADQAFLGRTGAAQSFAQAAGGEELNRYGLGLQAAQGADEGVRSNAGLLTSAANMSDQNRLARLNSGVTAGLNADQQQLARIMGGGTLANNAQNQWANRINTGLGVSQAADNANIAQGSAIQGLGSALSQTEITRLLGSSGAGASADTAELARIQAYLNGSKGMDDATLEKERFDRDTFASADDREASRTDREFNAASKVQQLFQDRERLGIQDMTGVASQLAGLVASATGASTTEQANYRNQIIQLLVTQMGMSREEAESQAAAWLGAAGNVAQAGSGYYNNRTTTPVTPPASSSGILA